MNTKIENIAYFGLTKEFDALYNNSKNGDNVYNLMSLILDERNIKLAYNELKAHMSSKIVDLDGKSIKDLTLLSEDEYVSFVRKRLSHYVPQKSKRGYKSKYYGGLYPVGISSIYDTLIEQCLMQVLEHICEARFYNHSY